MSKLDRTTVGYAPLTGNLYIFEADGLRRVAKNKRRADPAEILGPVVEYMIHDAPEGARQEVIVNGKVYTLEVRPKE